MQHSFDCDSYALGIHLGGWSQQVVDCDDIRLICFEQLQLGGTRSEKVGEADVELDEREARRVYLQECRSSVGHVLLKG